jgi:hypothetical protein
MNEDDFLTRCVVDPSTRSFYLYSSEGETKTVECDTVDQFMSVLELCQNVLTDEIAFAEPITQ